MVQQLLVITSTSTSPYYNLALESCLMEYVGPTQCILYLWQNENTVVIGRNQDAFRECKVAELEAAGGHLARRLSGGGAVFHDLGNLNFTFITTVQNYDVSRQTDVILQALQLVGITALRTGRNDLTINGRKFSGHAYYKTNDACYHHGTLMVNVNNTKLQRFLHPSAEKLASKGVTSVRSRVVNLIDIVPTLTVETLSAALCEAFKQTYRLPTQTLTASTLSQATLVKYETHYASRKWLFRDELPFTEHAQARFAWGEVTIHYTLAEHTIAACSIYSDAMDALFILQIQAALPTTPFIYADVRECLTKKATTPEQTAIASDISSLLFDTIRVTNL